MELAAALRLRMKLMLLAVGDQRFPAALSLTLIFDRALPELANRHSCHSMTA